MTPLQQAYLNKLRATADANRVFFEQNMPIHRSLLNESPVASVDISDQGDLSIRYEDGETLSVVNHMMEMEGRLARFADVADRPQILAFHNLREVEQNPGYGPMQAYHYTNLDPDYPNRVKKHFLSHYPTNDALSQYPEFGDNVIPLLIVIGSGLGWHLPRLLTQYQIRHLVVIETDVDAFRISTFFQDYVMLSRLAMGRGTDLSFVVQADVKKVTKSLMSVLTRNDGVPPFFIHGAALFYADGDEEVVTDIRSGIVETLWEMFYGLGYFDDELISIKHSLVNLRHHIPVYMKPRVIPDNAVAVIVGSGPSLDGLLPILREYRDRMVVFSGGSSLTGLAKAGIKPDFHIEKERPYLQYEIITKGVSPEFLEGINFIGLNVVHPDVYDLFGWKGMIMKAADTIVDVYLQQGLPQEIVLNTQPTAINTGIDIALSSGFKKIFLFGVDMGYRDETQHHSKHTFYHSKVFEKEDSLNKLLSGPPDSHTSIPGNFGGEVTTTRIFSIARQTIVHAIADYPDVEVFNLNDGALIEGAIPMHPEEFSCTSTPQDQQAALSALKGAFEDVPFSEAEVMRSLIAQIHDYNRQIDAYIKAMQGTRTGVIDTLCNLYQYTQKQVNEWQPTGYLFRGIIYHLLSLTFNAISIIKDEDEAVAKAAWDFANIQDFLEQAASEIEKVAREQGVQ